MNFLEEKSKDSSRQLELKFSEFLKLKKENACMKAFMKGFSDGVLDKITLSF